MARSSGDHDVEPVDSSQCTVHACLIDACLITNKTRSRQHKILSSVLPPIESVCTCTPFTSPMPDYETASTLANASQSHQRRSEP